MAFALRNRRINVTFTDTGNNDTTRTLDLGSNAFPDTLGLTALVATLLGVTTSKIKSYALVEEIVDNAFTLPTDAQVEANARLTMSIVGDPKKSGTFDIPSPSPSIMVATSGEGLNVVNLSNAAVLDVVALFQASGDFYISDGEKVSQLKKGRRITKRSTRG